MIARSSASQHICLRCQRNLRSRSAYLYSHGIYSHPNVRNFSDEASHPQSQPVDKYSTKRTADDGNDGNEVVVRRGFGLACKVPTPDLASRKFYGHRGHKLREKLEQLQTNSLGDPAKVIVLRDSIFNLYNYKRNQMPAVEPEHIDILGQLEDERGLVDQNEVNANISAFRPTSRQKPRNWFGINVLVSKLQDAFTMAQLESYVEGFKNRREPELAIPQWIPDEKDAPILRITPWQPGISQIEEYFDNDPLRGYHMESHTTKQRVILRLLRECWMLELPELREGIGQFELQIRQADLELLLMGPKSPLDTLHSTHLGFENEQLEAFRSRAVIRVTTTHNKKDVIVRAVEEILHQIKREQISFEDLFPGPRSKRQGRIKNWIDKYFNDAVLQKVAQLTNTIILRTTKKKISISGIDSTNSLSSKVDVAKRLLMTSVNFPNRVETQLGCLLPFSGTDKSELIPYLLIDDMSWRDKLRQWVRLTAPVPKDAKSSDATPEAISFPIPTPTMLDTSKQPMITNSSQRQIDNYAEKTIVGATAIADSATSSKYDSKQDSKDQLESDGEESLYWNSKDWVHTSASFGSVLHTYHHMAPNVKPAPKKDIAVSTFSTRIPNLSRILASAGHGMLSEGKTVDTVDNLILRFQPNVFHAPVGNDKVKGSIGAAALGAFPPIEMRLGINRDDEKTTLKRVHAVVKDIRAAVMLPENLVDVCFQQRTTRPLNRYHSNIKTFLGKSQLSIFSNANLETPPKIMLPIPKNLCLGQGFELLGLPKEGESATEREVEYLFAGLELRRTIAFEYKSWTMLYTSIEAGKAGGSRSELAMRPIKNGQQTSKEEFIAAAYAFAGEFGGTDIANTVATVRKMVVADGKTKLVRTVSTEGDEKSGTFFKYISRRPLTTAEVEEDVEDDGPVEAAVL